MKNFYFLFILYFTTAFGQQQNNTNIDLEQLIQRKNQLPATLKSIDHFFTPDEIALLEDHYTLPTSSSAGDLGDIAYLVENNGNFFGTTDLGSPGSFDIIAPSGNIHFDGAGAVSPDGSVAYSLGNNGAFYQVDLDTGDYTPLGDFFPPNLDWTGLEFDPTDGSLYALSSIDETGASSTTLCRINLTTLSLEIIGTNAIRLASSLAIDGDGNIYTYSVQNDSFYSLNKTTGSAAFIGSIGFDAQFAQGMCWDPFQDRVLMSAFNNDTMLMELREVNTTTGSSSRIFPVFGPGTQVGWISVGGSTLSNQDFTSNKVAIYPNPASDKLFLQTDLTEDVINYKVYSIAGLQLANGTYSAVGIDLQTLAKGIYFLELNTVEGRSLQKFIVE